jgi:hypothetical protein
MNSAGTIGVTAQLSLDDGIAAVRVILPSCEFDAGPCAEGLKALRAYRREWNEEYSTWRDKPRHDWASHGATHSACSHHAIAMLSQPRRSHGSPMSRIRCSW